jgi:hypothetical protein
MYKYGKKDIVHNPICSDLEKLGFSVLDISQLGNNKPDAVIAREDKTALVEFKTGNRKLKPGQFTFSLLWRGMYIIARSTKDVLEQWGKL